MISVRTCTLASRLTPSGLLHPDCSFHPRPSLILTLLSLHAILQPCRCSGNSIGCRAAWENGRSRSSVGSRCLTERYSPLGSLGTAILIPEVSGAGFVLCLRNSLGDELFIARIEVMLGRKLQKRKPSPAPRDRVCVPRTPDIQPQAAGASFVLCSRNPWSASARPSAASTCWARICLLSRLSPFHPAVVRSCAAFRTPVGSQARIGIALRRPRQQSLSLDEDLRGPY